MRRKVNAIGQNLFIERQSLSLARGNDLIVNRLLDLLEERQVMIHLDSEQKRVLKAISGSSLGMIAGLLLFYACSGKLDSWTDALVLLGIYLLIVIGMGAFYVLGSKIPKKDD